MTNGEGRAGVRRVAGVAVMLLGVVLIGYGAHYLIENSSGGGDPLSTLSVFLLGPALAVGGWGLGRLWGALWPATCIALGVGLVTIRPAPGATATAKAFGLVAGTCLLTCALASVFRIARRRLMARTTSAGSPVLEASPASPAGPGTTVVADIPAFPAVPSQPNAQGRCLMPLMKLDSR